MKFPTLPPTARIAAGVVLLGALAVGMRFLGQPENAVGKERPQADVPAVQVTTALVQQREVPIFRAGVGTVAAAQSVIVRTRIDGQLDRVGFTEGQDVKAGQVIAQLDPRTVQAQLAQAKAQQAKDNAQLANARRDLARYTQLIAEDAATHQQVDTQKALVAQLEATMATDAAAVRFQEVQLSYTTITAPISGRVGARLVDVGNIVHAADQNGLVVINQIDPVNVQFTLPEDAVQDVIRASREGRPLQVQALSRTDNHVLATGELILLNNQIDTTTGTVQLKGRFANGGHPLWPGQFVNVRLTLGKREQALVVPEAAVQRSPDGSFVYVVDQTEKKAQSRPVQVAQLQDGIAVVTGVQPGEHVVVSGQYKIKPGAPVKEVAAATQAKEPAKSAASAGTVARSTS